jgi:hypothetical protein
MVEALMPTDSPSLTTATTACAGAVWRMSSSPMTQNPEARSARHSASESMRGATLTMIRGGWPAGVSEGVSSIMTGSLPLRPPGVIVRIDELAVVSPSGLGASDRWSAGR